jgi:hypothetical protein
LWLECLESRNLPGFVAPLSFDAGQNPASVAVGDFNGDGAPDLAVANGSGTVSVLREAVTEIPGTSSLPI